MTTKIISVKTWRQNLTKLWKEAEGKNIRYIVMSHSKPIYEVKPIFKESLEIKENWKTKETYSLAEKNLAFWKGNADENLFDNSIDL